MKATLPEISVIGGIIADSDQCKNAFDLLTPEMFGNKWAANIFAVCKSLHDQGVHVDIATVEGAVGKQHRAFLVQCIEMMPVFIGFDDYCAAVLEQWRVRELRDGSLRLTECETSREWVEKTRLMLSRQDAIENGLKCSTATDFWNSGISFLNYIVMPTDALRSGMRGFDRVTGGLQRKGFYIIAGRSGLGKTDFALALAVNMSVQHRVSFCSMEMKKEELFGRIMSRVAQVDSGKIRDRTMMPDEVQRIVEGLSRMNERTQLIIDEQQGVSVDDLENKVLRQTPDVIFIDHIGLMCHPLKKNAWEGVAETSKRLKQLAMKHNIVVIGLAQETRGASGELKGSDNLENDADGIFLMKSDPPKTFVSGEGWIDAEVIVKKLRNGARGTLKYHWRPQYHEWRAVEEQL